MSSTFQADVCVIGGGVLGCMAARTLTRYQLKVLLIEKENDVCMGISRANTAIIYAGYDNKPDTLKSSLCVKGNMNFPFLCEELGVPISRCGSLMLCHGPRGAEVLKKKYKNGLQNHVSGLELISGEEAHALEPHLAGEIYMGLFSPNTATVQPWEIGIAAFENALENGCEIRLSAKVTDIEKTDGGFRITVSDSSAPKSSKTEVITARGILNCAGVYADRVRELLLPPSVRIYPEKADYFIFDKTVKGFLSHIIFEEPEEKGKGLTLVPTVNGNLLAGPSAQGNCECDDFSTSSDGLAFLEKRLGELLPELPLSAVIRNFASIRPNPFEVSQGENLEIIRSPRSIHSFVIDQPKDCPAFISLIGIKTPGLTCCEELAKYIVRQLLPVLGNPPLNPNFHSRRESPVCMRRLSLSEKTSCIQKDPSYGKIICRCEQVSEGEIRDAISRGAKTVDGVKRRCGTGMGACQGSRCSYEITRLLARELDKPISEICKDSSNSSFIKGDLT